LVINILRSKDVGLDIFKWEISAKQEKAIRIIGYILGARKRYREIIRAKISNERLVDNPQS
jgi:hypothetical protein